MIPQKEEVIGKPLLPDTRLYNLSLLGKKSVTSYRFTRKNVVKYCNKEYLLTVNPPDWRYFLGTF